METRQRRAPPAGPPPSTTTPPPPPPPLPPREATRETDPPRDSSDAAAPDSRSDAGESRLRGAGLAPPAPPPRAPLVPNADTSREDESGANDEVFVLVGRDPNAQKQRVGGSGPSSRGPPQVGQGNSARRVPTTVMRDDDATQSASAGASPDVPEPWILRVRAPARPFAADVSSSSYVPPVLHMRVSPETTPQALSEGIRHAFQLEPADSSIPGLFDEDSWVYYFLNDVLSQSRRPTPHQPRTYSLHAPLPPIPRPRDDSDRKHRLQHFLSKAVGQIREGVRTRPGAAMVAVLVVVLGVSVARSTIHPLQWFLTLFGRGEGWGYARRVLQSALYEAHHRTIVSPLRDMYRNGPWIIGGWEGDRLERVCARITYHGDESFWSRNLSECERIYSAKEAAWLRLTRPLANVVVLAALFVIGRRVLRRPIPRRLSPTERDAVETYRAMQVLVRQLKKNA